MKINSLERQLEALKEEFTVCAAASFEFESLIENAKNEKVKVDDETLAFARLSVMAVENRTEEIEDEIYEIIRQLQKQDPDEISNNLFDKWLTVDQYALFKHAKRNNLWRY